MPPANGTNSTWVQIRNAAIGGLVTLLVAASIAAASGVWGLKESAGDHRADIQSLRADLKAYIQSLRGDLNLGFHDLRAELRRNRDATCSDRPHIPQCEPTSASGVAP